MYVGGRGGRGVVDFNWKKHFLSGKDVKGKLKTPAFKS